MKIFYACIITILLICLKNWVGMAIWIGQSLPLPHPEKGLHNNSLK